MSMYYNPKVAHARAGTSVKYYVKTSGDKWFQAPYSNQSSVSPDGVEAVAS